METARYNLVAGSRQQAACPLKLNPQVGRGLLGLERGRPSSPSQSTLGEFYFWDPCTSLSFSPRSAISYSPPPIDPRAKDQHALAAEGPPLEASAEAIHFLNSLREPGLVRGWGLGGAGGGGYTSVERREGRRPRPGPVSLSLILLGLGKAQ